MDSVVRTIRDEKNIVTVTLDVPGKPVNTCSPQLLADLAQAIAEIEKNPPAGVIFASAKPKSFNAGADLHEIRKMNREEVLQYLTDGQTLFNRIASLPTPTVAAIGGDCMGGGCELALACTYRVAADNNAINIGLPETKLGLIPAWGGSTRLPRIIGLSRALPILLAGQTMTPRKAARVGLVDEVVRPEALMSAARRMLSTLPARHQPGKLDRVIAVVPKLRRKVLDKAEAQTRATTLGNYPAPMKLIEVVRVGYEQGERAGFDAERNAMIDLMETDATRNLLRLFFLKQASKKWTADEIKADARPIKHVAVIGGGTMGAGIVYALVRAGFQVRLIESDTNALGAALGRVKKQLDEDVQSHRMDRLAARHAMNRVAPSVEWTGLGLVDVVIEAVVENMDVKRDIFAKLDSLVRPETVLATNTSSLSVTEMASATKHPNRVVGLHFFNPVKKMPLVEVVRTAQSDGPSLASAVQLASRIGKVPILVGDAPGFVVNRVLIPYLREAISLALEGVPYTAIDQAIKQWGMPMGPFELLDEIGLDVASYVLKSLTPGVEAPVPPALKQAIERGWMGKKTGVGFYVHAKKKQLKPNAEMATLMYAGEPKSMSDEEIVDRLITPMVGEAMKLLDERIIASPDALDLATVLGIGFAPFRGGLANYANLAGTYAGPRDRSSNKVIESAVSGPH